MKKIESNDESLARELVYGTVAVGANELAWKLSERVLAPPDSGEPHRYQIIHVARGDKLYEYREDLGLASNFNVPEVEIPSAYIHTVQELREIADANRDRGNYWKRHMQNLRGESTLIVDAVEQREENHKYIHNRTVFGRGGQTKRNGFPSDYTNR